jgi:hypothetical protein
MIRLLLAQNITDEEVLNQMAIARDRLLKQRRDVMEKQWIILEADFKAKPSAHHLAAEILSFAA